MAEVRNRALAATIWNCKSPFYHPKKTLETVRECVMAEIAVNLLTSNLKELLTSKSYLVIKKKDQIQSLYDDLLLLRTELNHLQAKFFEHEQVKNLEARITDVAYQAENTIDSFIVNIFSTKNKMEASTVEEMKYIWMEEISLNLEHVKKEIETIKTEMMGIYDMGLEAIFYSLYI
ncbi:hypothetical protein ACSBR1_040078 [Camellia fascicularis]